MQTSPAKNELADRIEKFRKLMAIFILFLLFVFPISKLKGKLEQKLDETQKWDVAESENLLRAELSEFRRDLEPEYFLQKYLKRQLNEKYIVKAMIEATSLQSQKSNSDQQVRSEESANAIKAIFALASKSLCRKDSDMNPLFLIVTDNMLEERQWMLSDEFIEAPKLPWFKIDLSPNNTSPEKFEFLVQYITYFSYLGIQTPIRDNWRTPKINLFGALNQTGAWETSKHFFRGILSSFIKSEPSDNKVNTYLSDIFGFQNLYFYPLVIVKDKEFQGMVVVGFLEKQLQIQKLLKNSLKLQKSDRIKRFFFTKNNAPPIFPEDVLSMTHTLNSLTEGLSPDEQVEIGTAIMLPDHFSLKISIKSLSWLLKSGILFFFVLSIRTFLFNISFPLNLRRKLLGIFALAIVLPAISGTFLFLGITSNQKSASKGLAQTQLQSRFDAIELNYNELINRQVLNNLTLKLKLTHDLIEKTPSQLEPVDYKDYIGDNIQNIYIYDKIGETFAAMHLIKQVKSKRVLLCNSVSALSNMTKLEENQTTKKQLEEATFTLGFAEGLLGLINETNFSGAEAENVPRLSNFSSLSRSHFFLFPDLSNKNLPPRAVGFFDISSDKPFASFVRSSPDYPQDFFFKQGNNCSTEVHLAIRDSEETCRQFWLDQSLNQSEKFRRLFQNAMEMRSSGTSTDENSDRIFYSWQFQESYRIIVAGAVETIKDSLSSLFIELAPFFIMAITLLMLLLVSEVISSIFLSPLKTLAVGIKEIYQKGNLSVSVEFQNNDEFDQLGFSFNSMTRGLLQKKHIARFVSDRLVSAIESSESQLINESEKSVQMTILASDIRGFTAISENHPPETVVDLLNDYFTCMESCIIGEGGIIDKFIGDEILAVFLPDKLESPAISAIKAGLRMRLALKDFNEDAKNRWKISLDNGIGISTGEAIAATLGKTCARKDFTIVGELVEQAESLEELTKNGKHTKIMIDDSTRTAMNGAFKYSFAGSKNNYEYFEITKAGN